MKKKILILVALLPLLVFGQVPDNSKALTISLGGAYSPDLSYRTLLSGGSEFNEFIVDYRNSLEIPILGYTTGLTFFLNIGGGKMAIESGLLFSKRGYETKTYSPVWITPSGQPDPLLPSNLKYRYDYFYLDFPVKLNYFFAHERRLKFFVSGGLSTNFFLRQNTYSSYTMSSGQFISNSHSDMTGYNRVTTAGIVSIGLDYDLNRSFKFRFEPIFRYSITSIVNSPIKGYLYSLGANTSLIFNL